METIGSISTITPIRVNFSIFGVLILGITYLLSPPTLQESPKLWGLEGSLFMTEEMYKNFKERYPDPREDPKSKSLNGGSYKVPLVV